jgi:hypothetical protein
MAFIPVLTGTFPDDPNADTIRTAFNIVNSNFEQLFGNLSNIASNVNSVIAGTGISVDTAVGDVTITANLAAINVHSNTLYVSGIGGYITPGGNAGQDYTYVASTNTLLLDINSNVSLTLANVALTGNLTISGTSITAPNANINLSNGNITLSNGSFTGNISSTANLVQYANILGVVTTDSSFSYTPGVLTIASGNVNARRFIAEYLITSPQINVLNTVTANSVQISEIQFTGLAADPTPLDGKLYYNSVTGKLRLYNGVISDWQSLN